MTVPFDKMNSKQLRAWAKEQNRDRLADLARTVLYNPVVTLVGAFVAIDYFEYHGWPKYEYDEEGKRVQVASTNTMLGPASANMIRAGLIAGPVMDALGKVAEVAGGFAKIKALGGVAK